MARREAETGGNIGGQGIREEVAKPDSEQRFNLRTKIRRHTRLDNILHVRIARASFGPYSVQLLPVKLSGQLMSVAVHRNFGIFMHKLLRSRGTRGT